MGARTPTGHPNGGPRIGTKSDDAERLVPQTGTMHTPTPSAAPAPTSAPSPAPGTNDTTGAIAAEAINAVKIYGRGDTVVRALDDVTVGFRKGQFTAIMGPSGSG